MSLLKSYIGRLQDEAAYYKFQKERGERYRQIIGIDLTGKRVLEVGCGYGGIISAFNGCINVGIDIDKRKIYKAAKVTDNFNAVFMIGDATCMPYKNESFDLILLLDVIEHVDATKELIRECDRVLKRGGVLSVNFGSYKTAFGGHLILPYLHYLPKKVSFFFIEKLIARIETPINKSLFDIGSIKQQHETLNRIPTSIVLKLLKKYFTVEIETSTTVVPHLNIRRNAALIPDFLCISRFYICKK